MLGFLLACFLVGLGVVMLFSEEGRGCLAALVQLTLGLATITVLGGMVIFGALYLLVSL